MKKIVLTIICAITATGAAIAQGTVSWSTPPTAISAQTNSTVYSPLFGGGSTGGGAQGATGFAANGFYYELLYYGAANNNGGVQLAGGSAPSNSFAALFGGGWFDTGLGATNNVSGTAGRLNPISPSSGATVPWANGTTNSIVLVGWSSNLGTTWGVVSNLLATSTYAGVLAGQNGFFGVSTAGYINPSGTFVGVNVFGTSGQTYGLPINSINTQLYLLPVAPVPEPSTIALAGLGGLSLLLFRRRK
jgi:PEP-CTERM motif